MSEELELPEWVKTLIEKAREDGETEGRYAGYRQAWAEISSLADRNKW